MEAREYVSKVFMMALWMAQTATVSAGEADRPSKTDVVMKAIRSSIVKVNIVKPYTDQLKQKNSFKSFIINGSVVNNYRPQILEVCPATGVVLDKKGNIMVYVGERWLDLKNPHNRLEVITSEENKKYDGKLVGVDERIGFVIINSPVKLNPARIQPLTHLTVGEAICGVDFRESSPLVRVGSIERIHSDPKEKAELLVTFPRSLQYGRPVLDFRGNIIGVSVGRFGLRRIPPPGRTQEVVLPIAQVLPSAQQIISTRSDIPSGWLGARLDEITPKLKQQLNLSVDKGVLVRRVVGNSPAERAGMLENDVIVQYDGVPIESMKQLVGLVKETAIGKKVSIVVIRDGKQQTLAATVEKRKEINPVYIDLPEELEVHIPEIKTPKIEIPEIEIPDQNIKVQIPAFEVLSRPSSLGISIEDLTEQLGEYFGVKDGKGVLVSSTAKGGPADKAGIKAGDVIVKVDEAVVGNRLQLFKEMRKKNPGDKVKINLIRNKKPVDLYVVPEARSRTVQRRP